MKSNIEWKQWGEIDPLWAVSTWKGREKNGPKPWTKEDFYQYGESDWSDFHSQWQQYGLRAGVCLEFGCGAGRITKHLAAHFAKVIGIDVSQGMLTLAKQNVGTANVQFVLTEGTALPVPDQSLDAVFSTHVFQHFDSPADALQVFKQVHDALKADGTLMIHLPIYQWPNTGRRIYRAWYNIKRLQGDLVARWKRYLIKKGKWAVFMRGTCYEVEWMYNALEDMGFRNVELRVLKVRSNLCPHPFVLATR